jgi:hypothetical protein
MAKCLAAVLVLLLAAGCSAGAFVAAGSATDSATAVTDSATPQASAAGPQVSEPLEAETLRRLAFAYWDAYNAYDADTVLSYLEPGERSKREATIRSEIGQLKTFGVKLGVTEQSAPVLTGPETAEMLLAMKEPLGSRTIKMVFLLRDGRWLITAADEVPK